MSKHVEQKIAAATAAQYIRETAKAQVLLDRFTQPDGSERIGGYTLAKAQAWFELCKAKAERWSAKSSRLHRKIMDLGSEEDFGT